MTESWACRHFSLSNPTGEAQDDLPILLRRLADTIETLGDIDVLDVSYANEISEGADSPSFTVYFNPR